MNNKAFGIDLGTAYSCISYVDILGKPMVIDNSEGTSVTPSIVCFEDENTVVVGDIAKETAVVTPEATCEFVKRRMGIDKVAITYNGTDYSPEQISSLILKKLVRDAEAALDTEIKDVVITCPAYFGIAERTATENAGKIAGLNVLEIINEPTAAALYYGSLRNASDKVIMVYDLGATFDVSIIRATSKEIQLIAKGGECYLGGNDWDRSLMYYLESKFREQNNFYMEFDLDEQQDMILKAERAKQQLTMKSKTKVHLHANGISTAFEVTREKFEDITACLLKRTMDIVDDVVNHIMQKGIHNIDEIILVGGCSRMPCIRTKLAERFPNVPIKLSEPKEAVAKGAALYGNYLLNLKKKPLEKQIRYFTSKSFGMQIWKNEIIDGQMQAIPKIKNLITKYDKVPIRVTETFELSLENMSKVEFTFYETDITENIYDVGTNRILGTFALELPPNLPENHPIEVTISLSVDGLLRFYCIDNLSNNAINVETHSNVVWKEERTIRETETLHEYKLIEKTRFGLE